ncbi:HNH endonuclease [Pseudoalteromonas marina]|uniref:HNH endonuclease n=1 Tax=Pseudoalteromonas marina TaxID=267375 RepID=UPI003C45B5A0
MTQERSMPSKVKVFNHWSKILDVEIISKKCFACKSLDTHVLERCHIMPKNLGGEDTVENIHLLCRHCHVASEFLYGDKYWRWFESTRKDWFNISLTRSIPAMLGHGLLLSSDKLQKDVVNQNAVEYMELLADYEFILVSRRNRDASKAAKARGVKLGNPRLDEFRNTDTTNARAAKIRKAKQRNADILSVINEMRDSAETDLSLRDLAAMLNNAGYKTSRGKEWHPTSVNRVLETTSVKSI